MTDTLNTKELKRFAAVNRSVKKVDGVALVTGQPVYTDDFDVPGALHVKLVRSPHAHAIIKEIDVSRALKIPGVVTILTYKDLPRIPFTRAGQGYPEPSPYDTFVLDRKVRYVGDPVAIVAAETEKAARLGAKAVKVEYEVLDAVLDFEQATNEDAPIIHDEPEAIGIHDASKNIAAHFEMEIGNIDE
ncbi:MAG TPA: aldehyde oxidase, partial [Kosmotoga arenicorallina]|nr:aldehyde oxidase [Kosmotoga arenicorallina]